MSELRLLVSGGRYDTMSVKLDSGRIMVVAVPEKLSDDESEQVVEELNEIGDIVAGCQSPPSVG